MNPYFIWLIIKRIFRAAKVMVLLVSDRALVREMPWQAIRYRIKTRKMLLFQAVSLVLIVLMPVFAAIRPLQGVVPMLWMLWIAALFVPWLIRLVLDIRYRNADG